MELSKYDLNWAIIRLPNKLKDIMQTEEWRGKIYVGGGYLRALIAQENVNDVDVFCNSEIEAELLAHKLSDKKEDIVKTDNAYTIKGKLPIQIIHRWVFEKQEDVSDSFDFTICCAVFSYNGEWISYCDERFYMDLAAKRLVYRKPIRNEDAGGSMLRLLKYYQKGYRSPLDSIGAVISRLVSGIDREKVNVYNEDDVARVLTGLLVEVDPNVDPTHGAHLPSLNDTQ